jgi:hypothetical protein
MAHHRTAGGRFLLDHCHHLARGAVGKSSKRSVAVVPRNPTLLLAYELVLRPGSFLQHLRAASWNPHLAPHRSPRDFSSEVFVGGGGLRFSDVVFHSLEPDRAGASVLVPSGRATKIDFAADGGGACPRAWRSRWLIA